MDNSIIMGAEAVSLFCRLHVNTKKDLPVRSSEMGLLILVAKSETPVTSVLAADFFKVSKPMVAAMVASLRKKGYLEKAPLAGDKRSYRLCATEKAAALVEEAYQAYFCVMELLKTKMGGNFEKMIALLEQANQILLEEKQNG